MHSVSRTVSLEFKSQAWFHQHLAELMSRCHAYFHILPLVEREEAVAETLASVVQYVIRAAGRGKLQLLTPYTLILFFGRLCRAGRRMAGSKSTDAMSETAQRRGHHQLHSLDDSVRIPADRGGQMAPLWRALADSREDSPFDNVRRNLDYPTILDREKVGPKARRVFQFLCETHGQGSHRKLARELGISPTRVTQLKRELGTCLARNGYGPPATRSRPAGRRH